MREIKFRAWSPSKKEWRADWSLSTYEVVLDLNAERLDDDLILCQYTGLKDKNGKEIYEGDIVRVENSVRSWEVFYRHDRWHLRSGGECYDNGDYYEGDEVDWDRVEVIGNRYEHPALLGGKP